MKTWWWMSVDADELKFILNAEVHIFLKHIKMVLYTCSMIVVLLGHWEHVDAHDL